jgi:hypothetical protein
MAQDSSLPDFWDQRYQQGVTPWEGASPDAQMQRFITTLPQGSRVLLPGCGSASDVPWLLEAGMQVDAIDFSLEAIQRAALALKDTPVRLWQADFFALPAQQAYDAIFERAFLCALPPARWDDYTQKMAELQQQFADYFVLRQCQAVQNAIPVFAGQEFWMVWQRLPG